MKQLIYYILLLAVCLLCLFSCKQVQTENKAKKLKDELVIEVPQLVIPTFKDKNIAFDADSLASVFYAKLSSNKFYENDDFQYLWITADTLQQCRLKSLLTILNNARKHGVPDIFPIQRLANRIDWISRIDSMTHVDSIYLALIDIERLSTESCLEYINGMTFGFIDPKVAIGKLYDLPVLTPDSAYFIQLFAAVKQDPIFAMRESEPKHMKYLLLQDELRKWNNLSDSVFSAILLQKNKIYRLDDTGDDILLISKRLHLFGLLNNDTICSVNEELLDGVNKLRMYHSLSQSNFIDQQVIEILNTPVTQLADKVVANLERYRWRLPVKEESKNIEVNVASQKLQATDGHDVVLEMNVVVGRKYNRTPLLMSTLSYINLNPYWNVPKSIATKEILVKQKADSTYIQRNNMMLLDGAKSEVNPNNIDWKQMNVANFNYEIKQKPGKDNALGLIKFMFENDFSVYLHDTPTKSTFGRDSRAASHGCVRLQYPMLLAQFCLGNDSVFLDRLYYTVGLPNPDTHDAVNKDLIKLKDILTPSIPIGICLDYYTLYIPKGSDRVYSAEDIYDYDKKILDNLNALDVIK